MSLALITPLAADLWQLSFYRTDEGRPRLACRVTCCWESLTIILRTRRAEEEKLRTLVPGQRIFRAP